MNYDFLNICSNKYYEIRNVINSKLYIKLEGFNPTGSIKLKTAINLIDDYEKSGKIKCDSILVESSSGNLGVALAAIAANRGYNFTCVIDPFATKQNIKAMKALGASIILVDLKDKNGNYLNSRISKVKELLEQDSRYLWLNQYANPANPDAHYKFTAPSIFKAFDHIDYLFIGAGTTGTLMGCARYFKEYSSHTKIIAVDSVGSVTFGGKSSKRFIPGLGTGRRPEIFHDKDIDGIQIIAEEDTVVMCRQISRNEGLLIGGSTGTVLCGVRALKDTISQSAVVAAISLDIGEKYLDTIYKDDWVREHFGEHVLAQCHKSNSPLAT